MAALALLGCGSAQAVGASSAATATRPDEGRYFGLDDDGNTTTLTYDGHQLRDLTVGHHHLGSIPIVMHRWFWEETCQRGFCSKGYWKFDAQLEGSWRRADGERWHYFTLATEQRFAVGRYQGHNRVHHGQHLHFAFRGGRVHDLVVGSTSLGSVGVNFKGQFDICNADGMCLHGSWQSRHHVMALWQPEGAPAEDSHFWHAWWQDPGG